MWPAPLRVRPGFVVGAAALIVVVSLLAVLVIDIVDVAGLGDRLQPRTLWKVLYSNNRPVEWSQWLLLGSTVVGAGYVGGRSAVAGDSEAGRFFLFLSAGFALMLVEDAGDVRHVLSAGVGRVLGDDVLGVSHRVVSDVPYMIVLAALPIYALVRYGPAVWRSPSARRYVVAGYGLYALVGAANGFRHLGDVYRNIGARIDSWLLGGRFPVPGDMTQDRAHFMVMDGIVEESLELLAASCFVAIVLAYVDDVRAGRIASMPESPEPGDSRARS